MVYFLEVFSFFKIGNFRDSEEAELRWKYDPVGLEKKICKTSCVGSIQKGPVPSWKKFILNLEFNY